MPLCPKPATPRPASSAPLPGAPLSRCCAKAKLTILAHLAKSVPRQYTSRARERRQSGGQNLIGGRQEARQDTPRSRPTATAQHPVPFIQLYYTYFPKKVQFPAHTFVISGEMRTFARFKHKCAIVIHTSYRIEI